MTRIARRQLAAALPWLTIAGTAGAQIAWPTRPVTLFVPLAAGSTADILARIVAPALSARLGQPVVVENQPAAGGTVLLARLARSADDHSVALITQSTHAISPFLYRQPGYDPVVDFHPIAPAVSIANAFIVRADGPYRTHNDLAAALRARLDHLTFSSGGSGTTHHISGVLYGNAMGARPTHVPYRGAPAGVNAVIAGEVDFGFFNVPSVVELIRSGGLRGLAVTSPHRSPFLPELPTMAELGIEGCEMVFWMGFAAPARLPTIAVRRLREVFPAMLADADVQARLTRVGFEMPPPTSPGDFASVIAADMARLAPVVRAAGAQVD